MKKALLTGIAVLFLATGTAHAQLPPRHPDEIELSSDPKCFTPKGHYKCAFRSVCKEAWDTEMYLRKYGSPSARIPRPLPRECRHYREVAAQFPPGRRRPGIGWEAHMEECGLARIHVFRERLPMMHRDGWTGTRSTSTTCYAWFVWDQTHQSPTIIQRISWR